MPHKLFCNRQIPEPSNTVPPKFSFKFLPCYLPISACYGEDPATAPEDWKCNRCKDEDWQAVSFIYLLFSFWGFDAQLYFVLSVSLD